MSFKYDSDGFHYLLQLPNWEDRLYQKITVLNLPNWFKRDPGKTILIHNFACTEPNR